MYQKVNLNKNIMKTQSILIALAMTFFTQISIAQKAFTVNVKGKGAPILLFPGFGCTGELWEETVAELSKTNECHIFTFAGFGNVPPIEKPWLATIKEEIIKYVKDEKLEKPMLLGHSLGGTLSLWLAATETDMFKKAILVDALPGSAALMIPNYNGEMIPYDNPQSNAMFKMSKTEFDSMNSQSVAYMCLNKNKHEIINKWMGLVDRKTYVYGYIDMLNLDLRKDIAKIKIPVVILAATSPNSEMVRNTYNQQYKNLPNVVIHYAENAAHFVMYDQPEWFLKNVKLALN
jgi:pimeloyl-ACP methyl ester carboxylesterase